MTIFERIKSWLGFGTKPDAAPAEPTKVVTLPNGRRAQIDERGNFLGFEP